MASRAFSKARGDALAAEFDKSGHAKPVETVKCEVYENLTEQDIADLFLGRNHSRAVTAFEPEVVGVVPDPSFGGYGRHAYPYFVLVAADEQPADPAS